MILMTISLMFRGHWIPKPILRAFRWVTYVWMGFSFLFAFGFLATDILITSAKVFGIHWAMVGPVTLAQFQALLVSTCTLLASLYALYTGLKKPNVKQVSIKLKKWPTALNGFKLIQLSDIHIGPLLDRQFSQWLADTCNDLQADLITITGDLVDGKVADIETEVKPLSQLNAKHGVYFITGNHDHYSNASDWCQALARYGFKILRNQLVTINTGRGQFNLAGTDAYQEHLAQTFANHDAELATILLAHYPATFLEIQNHSVDLQLSGHTHGGQIWPFHYPVKWVNKFVAGLYRVGEAQLYVSRGTGFWGPPMRLFAPAEITLLTLYHET